MRERSRRVAPCGTAVAAAVVLAACGSNSPSSTAPSPSALHAEVTDPAGDAVVSPGISRSPDLVHAVVDAAGGNITFTIQFAPGTFDPQTTRVAIELDTDLNPTTGNLAAGPMGIDYVADIWAARTPATLIQQATPATCAGTGACYVTVGTTSANVAADSVTTSLPLTTIASAGGRLTYRVLAYASPPQTTPTVTTDIMPDITLAPAHVP